MPTGINSYAFCADYSRMADCLFAIQALEAGGGLAAQPAVLRLTRLLEKSALPKLYDRAVKLLGILEGININQGYRFGDFEENDFSSLNFNVGVPYDDGTGYSPGFQHYLLGDFEEADFSAYDFYVGYLDETNTGYSSRFQTILNIFAELCRRSGELDETQVQGINTALVPVLDLFRLIQVYLAEAGLYPCEPVNTVFNNSPALYLQAAGADGSDGVAAGIHLRWSLAGELGSGHLPQGDYYPGGAVTSGFNRPGDYVRVSRTPYVNPAGFTLDFGSAIPAIDSAALRWTYILNRTDLSPAISNTVRLTFIDRVKYEQLARVRNPQADTAAFLDAYDGLLEIAVDDKQLFAVGYTFLKSAAAGFAGLKIELHSQSGAEETINIRKTVSAGSGAVSGTIYGDNISRIRLRKSAGSSLSSFYFESYADFMATREADAWTVLGVDFALSLSDEAVLARLESAAYPVDNLWPQYKGGTTVRSANYHDKWNISRQDDPSVKDMVQQYLELAATDPRAVISLPNPSGAEFPGIGISLLDMLNLTALDYHFARMLGLGHIDTEPLSGAGSYCYRISYTNRPAAGEAPALLEYISLPTALADSRLPAAPVLKPLTYTFPVQNGVSNTMFDSRGYAVNAPVRVVNIAREPYLFDAPAASFFDDLAIAADFDIFENSRPVLYGVDYRPAGQQNYVKPEITSGQVVGHPYNANDPDFPGTGVAETVPLTDNPDSLYIHFEKSPGIHLYAIYAINWFSRTSAPSPERSTDATVFPVRNTLLPPSAVTAQYIQQENALLFTTETEQLWLYGRMIQFPGQDTGFTRVTFNWLDLTDISYVQDTAAFDFSGVLKPSAAKAWFNPGPPKQVAGLVSSLLPVSGQDGQLRVTAGEYTLLDGSVSSPVIAGSDLALFAGSLLVTPEGQFNILSVTAGTAGPVFLIEKTVITDTAQDPDDPIFYGTTRRFVSPQRGSRFTVTQNLSIPESWAPVEQGIQVVNFTDPQSPVTETSTDEEGNLNRYLVGGINGDAVVSQLYTADEAHELMPGFYSVTFDGISLPAHPQAGLPFDSTDPGANAPGAAHPPKVEWYKGLVRMPRAEAGADKKLLEVLRIVQADPLVLYIYDAGFQDDGILLSVSSSDPVSNVNFHPGYKAYLFPEPAGTFNGANILPAAPANDKKTMIGLQMRDERSGGTGFVSRISAPVILLARNITEPVRLDAPEVHGLKVRPDATTKAAFTYDMKIAPDASGGARTPFGMMFYRTTNEDILNALYAPATVSAIFDALNTRTTDEHFDQRYLELADLVFDPANPGHFNVFDALPQPYGFPLPDKANLTEPTDAPEIKTAKYEAVIVGTLLPLTAQMPVYSLIAEGQQTDSKQPKIRTIDGQLLDPADPAFDPFPMIRRFTKPGEANTTYVRFTDYTLFGSSRFLYFYGAAELSSQLETGPMSPFAGPVTVLHTLPAEAPIIRRYAMGPPPVVTAAPLAVTFYLSLFLAGDTITSVRVYRADSSDKALSLQTMDSYADYPLVFDDAEGIVVSDTFEDLPAAPLGESISYRLAFIRIISNEENQPEEVVSLGSRAVTVRLIDTVNPGAPELTYTTATHTLSWGQTANKSTYYLYQQNSRGNWQQVYSVQPALAAQGMAYTLPEAPVFSDPDGNRIYYRFKVRVQNSSGLFNLTENELTI